MTADDPALRGMTGGGGCDALVSIAFAGWQEKAVVAVTVTRINGMHAITCMARVDFRVPIFVDGARLELPARSSIGRIAEANGRRIAVIPGTTTERALQSVLRVADAAR